MSAQTQDPHPASQPPAIGFMAPPWLVAMQAMADKAEQDTQERLASEIYIHEEQTR